MPKPLTRETMADAHCGVAGCKGPACQLEMRGRCHPGAATRATYDKYRGVLSVRCAACEALIAEVLVAASERAIYLGSAEAMAADAWTTEHHKAHHSEADDGAIGGRYTYELTHTSLGLIVKIRCACGDGVDVTRYEEW